MKKVVIIGGVATGASTAARLRRLDETIEIVMIERGEYISFANCGLPYYLGDVITDRDELLIATPKLMKDRFHIDTRIHSEVTKINPFKNSVTIQSADRGTYEETYDYLVLAPGAKPIDFNFEEVSSDKVFTLRNMNDTDRIKTALDGVQKAIIIGGGYIGVEMAENLVEKNIEVTLVQALPHILAPFDDDMVILAENEMRKKGINLLLSEMAVALHETEVGVSLELESGNVVEGNILISAIGVVPDTDFLKDSGVSLGKRGHILTNEQMQTNIPNIYAGGDAVTVTDFVTKQVTAVPLAGPANKHGRIIADNICGIPSKYKDTQGSTVIKVFDLTLAATGNTERQLSLQGIEHQTIIIHPNHHAVYYPGAEQITLKLIFNSSGAILGAQAIGIAGVVKRIDVIATLLRMGGTIYDLTELELCYAPPYGSAKDPVNFAGYVAENVLTKKTDLVHPRELENIKDNPNIVVLDVRTLGERNFGKVDGSIHINVNDLRDHLDELDKEKEYWIYCAVGVRAYVAERILKQHGFQCKNIIGGYKTISALGLLVP
ncbi:FAD-dependent oxidoreductase [Lachnoclostridium phytofermentans]|uniref:FAD-dependent pyridine nucleotide-disulphide oxidoreductase n=1 Tax=Lachnoclostridium phytofermentans (strain ATCC 700394 / DSM 18823 / ISDg) TaxID=357809 RepID=A9KT26_LACP7|nr:FAD-dependent oxidoreductase [Lachnoclostridium phytofermentans]ABX42237.1 FAD-dependent pyridine nucleotide-disulphide oxidoreductase [Lachnoclostridium phytofermentans ISDg]